MEVGYNSKHLAMAGAKEAPPVSVKILRPVDVVLWVGLTSTSGAAVLMHVFGPLRMIFTVPFLVMPSVVAIAAVVLLRRRLYGRLRVVSHLVLLGGIAGFCATLVYDGVRPLLKLIFSFHYSFLP